jgi:hypothetical protein
VARSCASRSRERARISSPEPRRRVLERRQRLLEQPDRVTPGRQRRLSAQRDGDTAARSRRPCVGKLVRGERARLLAAAEREREL